MRAGSCSVSGRQAARSLGPSIVMSTEGSAMAGEFLPIGFSPFEAVEDRPHILVDGAPRRSSVVTLSHWPHSPTPLVLARDLSVEIVLAYTAFASGRGRLPRGAEGKQVSGLIELGRIARAVTNDHFDEDGLMSILVLVDPEFSFSHERRLVEVAACGDFGVVRPGADDGARIAFAIGPLAEHEAGSGASTSERYAAILPRVKDLVMHPDAYVPWWHEEMQLFEVGRRAIERGEVSIVEEPGSLDLAVVSRNGGTFARAPEGHIRVPEPSSPLIGASGGLPVHAAAVHSATPCSRILAFDGDRCELYFRYESWVRLVSRPVPLRPQLQPLAAELTSLEPGSVTWEASGVGAIVSRLRPADGVTELEPDVIADLVRSHLRAAPPGWDPFAFTSPYVLDTRGANDVRRDGRDGRGASRSSRRRRPRR